MNALEDKRVCGACGAKLYERPYLMARQASENVLSWRTVGLVVLFAVLVVVLTLR